MKDEKTLNTNVLEETGIINEIEEVEEIAIDINDNDEECTIDIVPDVPQEFIDKYGKNIQAKHGVNNTADNK